MLVSAEHLTFFSTAVETVQTQIKFCDFSHKCFQILGDFASVLPKDDILPISVKTVFKDKHTLSPFVELFSEDDGESARAALPDHIYMDAMGFGMGNCCLQVQWWSRELTCSPGLSAFCLAAILWRPW